MSFKKFLSGKNTSRKDKLLALIGESSSQKTINNRKSFLGRTRLVKAMFLAQYLDYQGSDFDLELDIGFSNYDFFIYNHGPFSSEIMADLDELKTDMIEETGSSSGNRIRLTEKGESELDRIKNNLKENELERIQRVAEVISGKNGKSLEEFSLELLNIEDEKENWIGVKVEKIIQGVENN